MPFQTIRKAEEASLKGHGAEESDTQCCQLLQLDVLSSPTPHDATRRDLDEVNLRDFIHSSPQPQYTTKRTLPSAGTTKISHAIDSTSNQTPKPLPTPTNDEAGGDETYLKGQKGGAREISDSAEQENGTDGVLNTTPQVPVERGSATAKTPGKKHIKRNKDGQLRVFDVEGNELGQMDEPTQKSSMSLTQENTPSVYARSMSIQKTLRNEYPSTATPDDEEDEDDHETIPITQNHSLNFREHASAESASIMTPNDTGFLAFEPFESMSQNSNEDEIISQDPSSYNVPMVRINNHVYEPQTPAPPQNPFQNQGSVMKPSQMFGATQPSSIGRLRTSPISERPSPDIYNDFSSPAKRQRTKSSPLGVPIEDTPSVRNTLTTSRSVSAFSSSESPPTTLLRTSGAKSFNTKPRIQTFDEAVPRPYVSMRTMSGNSRQDSETESDDSESNLPEKLRAQKRRLNREQSCGEEFAAIPPFKRPQSASTIPRKSIKRPISRSSAPPIEVPATSRRRSIRKDAVQPNEVTDLDDRESGVEDAQEDSVEVPSTGRTGRRRSMQEDYIAQCKGRDARDTQPDDVVADSQLGAGISTGLVAESSLVQEVANVSSSGHEKAAPWSPCPIQKKHNLLESAQSTESTNSFPEPSLPLQELKRSQKNLPTSTINKNQPMSDIPDTVPETSPVASADDGIIPMGEIASLSFGGDIDMTGLSQLPGFEVDQIRDELLGRTRESRRAPPDTTLSDIPPISSEVVATDPDSPSLPKHNNNVDKSTDCEEIPPVEEVSSKEIIDEGREQPKEQTKVNLRTKKGKDPAPPSTAQRRSMRSLESPAVVTLKAPPSTARHGLRTKTQLKGPSSELRRSSSRISTPLPSSRKPPAESINSRSSKRMSVSSSALSTPMPTQDLDLLEANSILSKATFETSSSPEPLAVAGTPAPKGKKAAPKTTKPKASGQAKKGPTAAVSKSAEKEKTAAKLAAKSNQPAATEVQGTPISTIGNRTSKRNSAATVVDEGKPALTRSSKRKSTARSSKESSADPLVLSGYSVAQNANDAASANLFSNMTFVVSYFNVRRFEERDHVIDLIRKNGGIVNDNGFEELFDGLDSDSLAVSTDARSVGFSALIADEHSRRAKYLQALALGLPCISSKWILNCVSKETILDWSPYILCAGESAFLDNAVKSRTLQPYSAAEATLETTFAARDKLLDGKSVLMVTGRGKTAQEKRKPYIFFARALGAGRVGKATDLAEARKTLVTSETEGQSYDLLYVDGPEDVTASAVFSSGTSGSTQKRKRGPTAVDDTPPPKRIRVINDETMIQSLILGQFMEE